MKTVLIYAPSSVYGAISSYPIIYKIHQIYKELKLHIVVDEDLGEYYDFFDFRVSIHILPKTKKNILGIHHYCANLLEVFNVDIYYDLQGGFLAASLGLNFKSPDRIGFLGRSNKFLLNHRVALKTDALLDSQFISLLEEFEGISCSEFYLGQIHTAETSINMNNIVPLFKEPVKEKNVLVFIDDLHVSKDSWLSLFETFENINFIFWDMGPAENYSEMIEFLDKERGLFRYIEGKKISELDKLIDLCDGVITNQEWFGNIASIREKKTFLFVKKLSALKKFRHLVFDGAHIEYTIDSLIKLYGPDNKFIDIRLPCQVSDYFLEFVYPNDKNEGIENDKN